MEGPRARIAQAQASAKGALASFDGTVLKSLQETETALSAYARMLDRQQALRTASEQARVAARITRAQLREGRVDSLAVLDAERTLAGTEADLAQADAQVAETQIDLFRSLGGGWQ
jgi:outer membrane protein TolC